MTIPLLIELGYEKDFSTAIVAVAGGLGVIIPPSIPFIMYAMATGESVSELFLAGIVPGMMISALLIFTHIITAAVTVRTERRSRRKWISSKQKDSLTF